MRIFRYITSQGPRLGLEIGGERRDLSSAGPVFADVSTWLAAPDPVAAVRAARPGDALPESLRAAAPVDKQEVWASGVTYLRSKAARMEESEHAGDFYDRVYTAERPELFFKHNAWRVSGPGEPIRIRKDSAWNVPEPELALVLSSRGRIVGFTIGNDVSSRSIEGENPLYLPQAKVYEGSCALGPVILVNDEPPQTRGIRLSIERQGAEVFAGETSTAQIRRSFEELASYLFRELSFPDGAVLLTGTGIVPPEDFTLRGGDVVRIRIDGIGELENPVRGD
ncbi:MAG TPA: fumarylacetoacetate hydrolase family protein [Terriglobia bacterium]|nr:fumarylacetoacetate hydrolase family protein [Terriglobia bacterium]